MEGCKMNLKKQNMTQECSIILLPRTQKTQQGLCTFLTQLLGAQLQAGDQQGQGLASDDGVFE